MAEDLVKPNIGTLTFYTNLYRIISVTPATILKVECGKMNEREVDVGQITICLFQKMKLLPEELFPHFWA